MSGFQRSVAGHAGSSATQTQTQTQPRPKVARDAHGNVFKVPDYSIKDILSAIPPECYQRSLAKSLAFVARDIAAIVGLGLLAHLYVAPQLAESAWFVRFLFWNVYAAAVGLFSTGLWILAHECGHQAFSDYGAVNDFVGWVLHSYLLVPYFSWKYSHSKHHKATGHLHRDMVFLPPTKQEFWSYRGWAANVAEYTEDSPLRTLGELVLQQLGGWIGHLFTNVTGQKYPDAPAWKRNHFWPTSPLFDAKDTLYIALSDLGVLAQCVVLRMWYLKFGGWSLFINWFVPYLWVNHWLVFITFLQHTDQTLPHYDNSEWSFAKGAAATIDRQLAFVGPHIFHDIIETHVLHHFVSRIPFYNARPASEAIKKVMGEHYRSCDENMFKSFWKVARSCQYVDGKDGLFMFRNVNNVGIGTGAAEESS
ncbi:LANO_0H18074g1_1 [Lachancea nothofagi CBS 11611]|uniref:LANO_0H18074g1_1 n=1 Tax=Lachancea nothofagi CBS 11611 TaxID=1266666 RepID=A0A1G4KN73_9SACH|nr:LANO_0H18074g1_1 [Lachancea nothofagi CBS 11611]